MFGGSHTPNLRELERLDGPGSLKAILMIYYCQATSGKDGYWWGSVIVRIAT